MASTFAYANSKTPYIDMYGDYKKEQQGIRDAFRKQLETDRSAAETSSNAEYDNAARQNYINYMQARKRLPSELNALGIRGGASESSALRLGTNYGSNVASNEASRNSALAAIRQQYEDKLAQYDEEWDNKLQQAYLTAIENQLKWEQEQQAASGGSGGGGSRRRSYGGYGGYGGYTDDDDVVVNNNGNSSAAAVKAAQQRGKALTDYYKKAGSKASSYKNKKTTNVSGKQKKYNWNYLIKGEKSRNWQ